MPDASHKNQWLADTRPLVPGVLRLLCFPYAGGGASAFRAWSSALPDEVAVSPVQLPGREGRLSEPPFTSLPPLVRAAAAALLPHLAEPFALYGHSMGALVAFELARLLRSEHGVEPAGLFVSACPAPHLPRLKPPTYNLPEEEFREHLRRLGGTPQEVLDHPELMTLMTPILRADFEVVETYAYQTGEPLSCPIKVYGGLQDAEVSREELERWREQTTAHSSLKMFPGDHFFIHTDHEPFLRDLARDLNALPRRRA